MTTDIETTEDGMRKYTVVAAAVTVTTGMKPNGQPESTRLLKGDTINADPRNESIRTLLGFRSIILSSKLEDGRERVTTARTIFDVSKQTGEATGVQDKQFVPLDAPAQATQPDTL